MSEPIATSWQRSAVGMVDPDARNLRNVNEITKK